MPFDGTNCDYTVREDLRIMRGALASLACKSAWCRNYGDGPAHCVVAWLNIHAGEHPVLGAAGYKIAADHLYPSLPRLRLPFSYVSPGDEANEVMLFNDFEGYWRIKRLLKRAIRRLEQSIA